MAQLSSSIIEYICKNPYCTQADIVQNVDRCTKSTTLVQQQLSCVRKLLRYLQIHGFFLRGEKPIPCKANFENPVAGTLLMIAIFWSDNMSDEDVYSLGEGLNLSVEFCRVRINDIRRAKKVLIESNLLTLGQ